MKNLRLNALVTVLALSAPAAYSSTAAISSFSNDQVAGHSNFDLAGFQFSTATAIQITSLGMWVSGGSLADTHQHRRLRPLRQSPVRRDRRCRAHSGRLWLHLGWRQWQRRPLRRQLVHRRAVQPEQQRRNVCRQRQHHHGLWPDVPQCRRVLQQFSGQHVGSRRHRLPFTEGLPRDAYIGPNFTFVPATDTPEPATWGMLLIGAAAFAVRRRS